VPEPWPGEVRIRLEGCGVCSSNLGPWAGPSWMTFPTAPGDLGHEGGGTIDVFGPDVVGLTLGDHVAAHTYHAYAAYYVALSAISGTKAGARSTLSGPTSKGWRPATPWPRSPTMPMPNSTWRRRRISSGCRRDLPAGHFQASRSAAR